MCGWAKGHTMQINMLLYSVYNYSDKLLNILNLGLVYMKVGTDWKLSRKAERWLQSLNFINFPKIVETVESIPLSNLDV